MRNIYVILVVVFFSVTAVAQEASELSRQVEVTKDYVPDVDVATKLSLSPNMVDTVSLRPRINYAIRPVAWLGSFGIEPIKPITLTSVSFVEEPTLYVKAGIGYPLSTVLDSYYVSGDSDGSYWGAYVNHRGDFGDIKNDRDISVDADRTTNKIGVFGTKNFGHFQAGGSVDYNYDLYTDYGQFSLASLGENYSLSSYGTPGTLTYSTPEGNVWFRSTYDEVGNLNFGINTGVYYMSGDDSDEEFGWNIGATLKYGLSQNNTIELDIENQFYNGNGSLSSYRNNLLRITPKYKGIIGQFSIEGGIDFINDNILDGDSKFWALPTLEVSWMRGSKILIPFIFIGGDILNNGMKNSITRNPYLLSPVANFNTLSYDMFVGIRGNIKSNMAYNLFLGAIILRDQEVIANVYQEGSTSRFMYLDSDDGVAFRLGGEFKGHVQNRFFYNFSANYYNYDMERQEKISALPNYDMGLLLSYSINDDVRVRLDTKLIGERHFYVKTFGITPSDVLIESVDPVVDMNLGVDWDVKENIGLFLEVDNILGSNLYQFNHYPSIGVTCMIGVKMIF